MSASIAQGDRCFVEEEYDEAVRHYSEAISQEPSAGAYQARANAYIKLEKYIEAAEDANKAIALDGGNPKAYLRKGIACYYLEEYETALQALEEGMALSPETSAFKTWHRKCKAEIEDEAEGSAPTKPSTQPSPKPAAQLRPTPAPAASPLLSAPASTSAPAQQRQQAASSSSTGNETQQAAAAASGPLAPAAAPEFIGKYRHQWYQIQNKVVVDVYAKGLPKERVAVECDGAHLTISIKADPAAAAETAAGSSGEEAQAGLPEGVEYQLDLELYAPVVTSGLVVEVLRTKVEVSLPKADATLNWATLEKSGKVAAPNWSVPTDPAAAQQYPTSFKTPKDWSKVNAELAELEQKGELEDGDPLQNFFKKIFSQGDEEQRRAMMKSYVESNGTVLSTNWSEVGTKKVECTPPEGMELHKWNE